MKVNDYVRTDDGLIGKIVSEPYEYKDSIVHDIDFGDNNIYNEYEMYQNIIKISPSIIDILEVGDYVNGCKIIELSTNIDGKVLYLETDITEFDNVYACGHINIYENDIKSIVTKEQFKNIEYEVK